MEWTLANIIRTHAATRGGKAMLTYAGHSTSYAEMDAASSRVAQGLLAQGIGPQDRVAFLDKDGPEYFEVLFGGAKINAVNVAVNWRLASGEMEHTINDAEAKVLFVGSAFQSQLEEMEERLKTVRKVIVIGEHPRHETYGAWIGRASRAIPALPRRGTMWPCSSTRRAPPASPRARCCRTGISARSCPTSPDRGGSTRHP
jgi:acyl-CoA synthetase (AMP-forming)/AMP-acid ligase II